MARTTKLGWLAPVVVTNASARSSAAPLLSTQLHARRNSAVVRPGVLARLTVLLRRTLLLAPYFETPSKVPTATRGTWFGFGLWSWLELGFGFELEG